MSNNPVTFRTQVSYYNDPSYGQGADPSIFTAQLTGSLGVENSVLGQTTATNIFADGLTIWDGQPGVYDHWQCLNEFIQDPGTILIPTSNPNGTNIAVTHSSPMITLIRRWTAKRTGAPPTLIPAGIVPDVLGNPDPNWILVRSPSPQIRELGVAADGVSIVYEASGYYVFSAIDATLVNYFADIPPTLDPLQLQTPSRWLMGQVGGAPQLNMVINGGGPLGGNPLPVTFPN